jgi:hypothetical protein
MLKPEGAFAELYTMGFWHVLSERVQRLERIDRDVGIPTSYG